MAVKQFTLAEVAKHNSKDDLYVIIDEKVYDASKFIDEHPGGDDVLKEIAGQDATEPFSNVGHSDDAREILKGLQIGGVKRMPGDPKPAVARAAQAPKAVPAKTTPQKGGGSSSYVLILLASIVAYGAYQYMQNQKEET